MTPQQVVPHHPEKEASLHAPFHREQFPLWEPLQLPPQLPDPKELPLLRQERVEQVPRPLVERLEAQRPPLPPMDPLKSPPQLAPSRPELEELPEKPAAALRRQLELPQPRPAMQRVRELLLADPVVPSPPPR